MDEQTVQPEKKPYSEFAIASLVLGLLSFLNVMNLDKVLCALIFGILSLRSIKQTQNKGKGMAIAGIVLAILYVVVLAVALYMFWPQVVTYIQTMKERVQQ
jgi:hypothetical protein